MKLSLKNMRHFLRDMARTVIRGELDSPDFIILDEKEVIFASVAKSACSSIKTSICGTPPEGVKIHQHTSHLSHGRIPKKKGQYFVLSLIHI